MFKYARYLFSGKLKISLTHRRALHPGGGVDGVPEEAVARHLGPHDPRHDRPGVDAGGDGDGLGLPVRPHHHPGGDVQADGHAADLLGVLVAVLLGQPGGDLGKLTIGHCVM